MCIRDRLNTELVTADELELYYAHLERTLIDIGFLDPELSLIHI